MRQGTYAVAASAIGLVSLRLLGTALRL